MQNSLALYIFVFVVAVANYITEPPSQPRLLTVVIIKTRDDELSPSLHNHINLINANTLSDGRNRPKQVVVIIL